MPDTLVPIKQYIDTAANLSSSNPTPLERQIIYESDTGERKIGDGSTAYNSLPYAKNPTVHHQVGITVDNSGSVVTSGTKGRIQVGFTGTLVGVTLLAKESGTVRFGITKGSFSDFPSSMTSIVGTNQAELSSAQKAEITLDGGWTTSITTGDILEFGIAGSPSPATITQVTIILFYDE